MDSQRTDIPVSPIIDAHVHTHRSRDTGRRATMATGQTGYGGTVDELLELMARAGPQRASRSGGVTIALWSLGGRC